MEILSAMFFALMSGAHPAPIAARLARAFRFFAFIDALPVRADLIDTGLDEWAVSRHSR